MPNGEHAFRVPAPPRRTDFIRGLRKRVCIYVYPIPDPNPGAQPKNPASHSRFNLIKNVQQDTMLRIQMKCQGKVGWVGFLGNGKGERKGDFPGGGWAVGRWAWHGVGSKHQTGCAK